MPWLLTPLNHLNRLNHQQHNPQLLPERHRLYPKSGSTTPGPSIHGEAPAPNPPRDIARGDFDRIVRIMGERFLAVPVDGDSNGVVVATADPLNTQPIDELRLCYKRPIQVVVTTPEEVSKAINAIRTSLMSDKSSALSEDKDAEAGSSFDAPLKIDVTDAEDDDAPIIRYVNAIIFKASSERASDVHVEPYEEALKVRFRIDGILHEVSN